MAVAILALVNGGCLFVAAGAAAGTALCYAYYNGKLCHTFAAPLQTTWKAASRAMADLGMPVQEYEHDIDGGCLYSEASDGTHLRVCLTAIPPESPADSPLTQVCIRVGTFGDHRLSARILDQIGVHLANDLPEAAPLIRGVHFAEPPLIEQTGKEPPLAARITLQE